MRVTTCKLSEDVKGQKKKQKVKLTWLHRGYG